MSRRISTLLAVAGTVAGLLAAAPTAGAAVQLTGSSATTTSGGQAESRQAELRAAAEQAAATGGRHICYSVLLTGSGWQAPVCDGAVAGTVGQSRQLEAVNIIPADGGTVCGVAHVQNLGWQPQQCGSEFAPLLLGTVGQGLRLESVGVTSSSGSVCAAGHVQNIGWQPKVCSDIPGRFTYIGTTGQALRLEAMLFTV
ncbi:hypothetical protein [Kitasatospora sp. NPDC050543]|uniref:hypothetical protein n=1 Tax=Kitasatospora sp. NPDC050543 TaxID=3364054 RepID=UPI0037A08681